MHDLRALESFVWIARLGSFRAASERLNLPQPTLSTRIARLDEQLGVALFRRDGRRVALTARGQLLLDHAERLLAQRAELLAAVADPGALGGTVRLGMAETIVHTWLPTLIRRLHERYPAISLELEVDTTPHLRDALVRHELDVAFLMGPVSHARIHNRPLCRYPLAWVASPQLGLPEGPVPLARLADWPIITYPRLSRPYVQIREMLGQLRDRRPRIHGSSSLATIVRMTLDGIGISAIPPRIVAGELAEDRLRLVASDAALPPLEFTASYASSPDSHMAEVVTRLALEVAAEDAAAVG